MVDPASAASPTNEEEYPQADSGSRKPNNQKDSSDSTFVVQEPMSRQYKYAIANLTRQIKLTGSLNLSHY
jgi:hypothetical protein